MNLAIAEADKTMNENIGGPFGACIVDQTGKVLAIASNSVLKDHDPTAHAEINAIRKATSLLKSHDLSGCTIYTTAYPCPMCLGAIIWANMKNVVYGCRPQDSEAIGFRDDFIYRFIEGGKSDVEVLSIEEKHRDVCLHLFQDYTKKSKEIY